MGSRCDDALRVASGLVVDVPFRPLSCSGRHSTSCKEEGTALAIVFLAFAPTYRKHPRALMFAGITGFSKKTTAQQLFAPSRLRRQVTPFPGCSPKGRSPSDRSR